MSETEEKHRRSRRTKVAIERDVLNAVNALVEEIGFSNITLTGVASRAKVEPAVFYRRYANLEELFDQYTHKFDYWLGNLAESMPDDLSDEDTFKWLMSSLVKALYKNKGMQQLLVWELAQDNHVTRRTAALREHVNEQLIRNLEGRFKGTGVDMNAITALMISGIYYLILHRNRSRFCDIDFSTKAGREQMEAAVDQLSSIIFAHFRSQQEKQAIAGRMRAEGISEDVIARCIGA